MNLEHLENVKQAFNDVANNQERKGIMKYGQPLNPMDKYDWLEMCIEELTDAYKYLVAEQAKREIAVRKIRNRTDDTEIMHWLDVLEGRL